MKNRGCVADAFLERFGAALGRPRVARSKFPRTILGRIFFQKSKNGIENDIQKSMPKKYWKIIAKGSENDAKKDGEINEFSCFLKKAKSHETLCFFKWNVVLCMQKGIKNQSTFNQNSSIFNQNSMTGQRNPIKINQNSIKTIQIRKKCPPKSNQLRSKSNQHSTKYNENSIPNQPKPIKLNQHREKEEPPEFKQTSTKSDQRAPRRGRRETRKEEPPAGAEQT